MSDTQDQFSTDATACKFSGPIPAARPLSDFCMEQIGDEVVLYDPEQIQYHTLNAAAYAVWRMCDGHRSTGDISREQASAGSEVHVEAVMLAVAQLEESGLLNSSDSVFDVRIERRKVLKLATAGIITAVGIPIVSSITAPDATAQTSCGIQCTVPQTCCGGVCRLPNGGICGVVSSACCSGCCKNALTGGGVCVAPGAGTTCF